MRVVLIGAVLALGLVGCSGKPWAKEQSDARSLTAARLKDPDSVKFRNVKVSHFANQIYVFCGEENSKNGFGGYVGFDKFIASHKTVEMPDDFINRDAFDHLWNIACAAPISTVKF